MNTTVNFFSEGFFGYAKEKDFYIGSIWHILPISIMIIAIILIYRYRKQIKSFKYEDCIRYIIAFIMLIVEMSYFWRLLYVGSQGTHDTMFFYLPFQICQWGLIICVFTMTSKNQKLFSINYYMTLLFATIALVSPIVITYTGPSYYRYYQFWLEHILPIISVFYLMFVHELKPDYRGIYRTFLVLIPLTIVALFANSNIEGANYLYLNIDVPVLPNNQIIKSIILTIITIGVFNLMYLPFMAKRSKCK